MNQDLILGNLTAIFKYLTLKRPCRNLFWISVSNLLLGSIFTQQSVQHSSEAANRHVNISWSNSAEIYKTHGIMDFIFFAVRKKKKTVGFLSNSRKANIRTFMDHFYTFLQFQFHKTMGKMIQGCLQLLQNLVCIFSRQQVSLATLHWFMPTCKPLVQDSPEMLVVISVSAVWPKPLVVRARTDTR